MTNKMIETGPVTEAEWAKDVEARSSADSKYARLPCPFCGHEPYAAMDIRGAVIRCENPDCFGPRTTAAYLVDALQQWNKRASIPGAAQGATWPQPIATAPKDGTEFIGHENGDVYKCCWRTEEPDEGPGHSGWWDFSNQSFENPTEWSPLRYPAPGRCSADTEDAGQ